MSAGSCQGLLSLAGPSQDFDVLSAHPPSGAGPSSAATVPFRLQIRDVEWSVAGALDFGDLGRAGEKATETLLLRFNGKTPFVVEVVGMAASGETDNGVMSLDHSFLEAPPVEVNGQPDDEGFFEVPITLIARKALPKDALSGSFYSGELLLSIVGLAGETRSVDINFRSPTLYQRYVEWWLRPFYTFPLVFCSGPMALLALLIVVARARTRGYNMEDDEDPGLTLPGQDSPLTPGYAAVPGSPKAGTTPMGRMPRSSRRMRPGGQRTRPTRRPSQDMRQVRQAIPLPLRILPIPRLSVLPVPAVRTVGKAPLRERSSPPGTQVGTRVAGGATLTRPQGPVISAGQKRPATTGAVRLRPRAMGRLATKRTVHLPIHGAARETVSSPRPSKRCCRTLLPASEVLTVGSDMIAWQPARTSAVVRD